MDWNKLKIFKVVCDVGSLTKASQKLHLTQSSLSRQITKLEEELGVTLFHRHARGLVPTHHGDVLYATSKKVQSILEATQDELGQSDTDLSGTLRVSVPTLFGTHWVAAQLHPFTYLYPNLKLDFDFSDERADLRKREADIAVRIGFHEDTDLFQRYLISYRWRAYASPGYLLGRGPLNDVAEITDHSLLQLVNPANRWLAEGASWLTDLLDQDALQSLTQVTANNLEGLHRAAHNSLGIVSLPEFMLDELSPLEPVLTQHVGPEFDIYFVCARELRDSERVQIFYDSLKSKIDKAETTYADSASIQCPECHKPPPDEDRWKCTCGTVWNTFETHGCCPNCGQHWGQTECHVCRKVSPHLDWYILAES